MKPVLSEETAAEMLHLSPRTLQRFRVEGRGPKFVKLGKRVFYREQDLEDYVNRSVRESTSAPAA